MAEDVVRFQMYTPAENRAAVIGCVVGGGIGLGNIVMHQYNVQSYATSTKTAGAELRELKLLQQDVVVAASEEGPTLAQLAVDARIVKKQDEVSALVSKQPESHIGMDVAIMGADFALGAAAAAAFVCSIRCIKAGRRHKKLQRADVEIAELNSWFERSN